MNIVAPNASKGHPITCPVIPGNIPDLLKGLTRWVVWRAGPPKDGGKFDKIPVDAVTGRAVSPLDPTNWLPFNRAMDAYDRGGVQGVGIVLTRDQPLTHNGETFFLIALDFDQCRDRLSDLKLIWMDLGKPYVEQSPSGRGLRMFGLSRQPIRGGNAGNGRELYSHGRFVTVTGFDARGTIRDITDGATALEREWFGDRGVRGGQKLAARPTPALPESAENLIVVLAQLNLISSDTDYDTWRDICWSIMSTEWLCAREVAHRWSKKAPGRYDAAALGGLLDSFDPARGISLGTLRHHARKNGWTDSSADLPPEQAQPVHLLLTASQLRQLPATPYVVRNILPAQGLAAIYGEPGSGKSFLALDLAHAIAAGRSDWFGFNVRQAPVAYVALEGQAGIGRRTDALELHTRIACPDALRFWCRDLSLLRPEHVDGLADEVNRILGEGSVAIIDTLNQASPGADENSSADMGRIIAHAKKLAGQIDGLVILVHHAGKDRSRGLRGHSSLFAALDAVIEVYASSAGREWRLSKAKDDQADVTRDFELVPYVVGSDEWGELKSCAVRPAIHIKAAPKRPIAGKHQRPAMEKLRNLLRDQADRIEYRAAIAAVATVLDAHPDRAPARAKEAIDALIRAGHLSLGEGGLCIPQS